MPRTVRTSLTNKTREVENRRTYHYLRLRARDESRSRSLDPDDFGADVAMFLMRTDDDDSAAKKID